MALAVAVLSTAWIANAWASSVVDARAKQAAISLKGVLERTTVADILISPATIELPEGRPFREIAKEGTGASLTVEIRRLWQVRCVVGHLDSRGHETVEIKACALR